MADILEKHQYYILLYDLYGGLLTAKQQNIFDLYYQDDYSIGEIAEELEISKQAVFDALKRSEKILAEYENKLALAAKEISRREIVRKINERLQKCAEEELKGELLDLLAQLNMTEEE